jgi:hypothetical protein
MSPNLNQTVWIISKNNKIEEYIWRLEGNPHHFFWSEKEAKDYLISVEEALRKDLF